MGFFSDWGKGLGDLASGHLGSAWHDMTQLDANYVVPAGLDAVGSAYGVPPEATNAAYSGIKGGINHGSSGIIPGAEQGVVSGAEFDALNAGANIGAGAAGYGGTGLSTPLSAGADSLGLTGSASSGTGGGGSWFSNLFSNSGGGTVSGGQGTPSLMGNIGGDNLTGGGAVGAETDAMSADPTIPSSLDPNNISNLFANSATGTGTGGTTDAFGANAFGAGGGGGTAAAPAGNSISNLINNPSWANAGKAAGNNIGSLISAGNLGLAASKNNAQLQGQKGLAATASQEGVNSKQMESYLQNGTLPAGVQASINQATDSQKAQIRSSYAAKGMSGSSAEAQDLANADQNAQANGAKIAMDLMNTGIKESGLSSQIYAQLMEQSYKNDQNLQQAIGNFASNLSGGGGGKGGITINNGVVQ